MDELLLFHERIGSDINRQQIAFLRENFGNANDLIVILYGCAAVFAMLLVLPTVLEFPRFIELFGLAFVFYLIHTITDSTQEPPTFASHVIEESAKLLCSATLAVAHFAGLMTVARGVVSDRPSDP